MNTHYEEDEEDDDDDDDEENNTTTSQNNTYNQEHIPLLRCTPTNTQHHHTTQRLRNINSNSTINKVYFYFILLVSSYTIERLTFKYLIDRTSSLRLYTISLGINIFHVLLGSTITTIAFFYNKYYSDRDNTININNYFCIPIYDICIMSCLDALSLILYVISGTKVPPVLTVLLLQLVIPLSSSLSPLFYTASATSFATSTKQMVGISLLYLSIVLCILPSIYTILPHSTSSSSILSLSSSFNILLYTASTIPCTISTLYKESILLKYKQPIQSSIFNIILSIFQSFFVIILSPACYILLGFGEEDWLSLYPLRGIIDNFIHSFYCIFGSTYEDNDMDQLTYDCDYVYIYLMVHVGAILILNLSLDRMIALQSNSTASNTGYVDRDASMTSLSTISTNINTTSSNKKPKLFYYHGISIGILSSVISLYIYGIIYTNKSTTYYESSSMYMNILYFVITILIIIGNEIYYSSCYGTITDNVLHVNDGTNSFGNVISTSGGHIFETAYRSTSDYYNIDYD